MLNCPAGLDASLRNTHASPEQKRPVAHVLAGPTLKGGELPDVSPSGEVAGLRKLLANWKSVVEEATISAQEIQDRRTGQTSMHFERENGQ